MLVAALEAFDAMPSDVVVGLALVVLGGLLVASERRRRLDHA